MYNDLNEVAAMQFLITFIPLKEIVIAAMHGFAEGNSTKDKENADLCYKALQTFFNK